eukprot:TRINITY_DN13418_c0_g1_i1.p1 TRINITY_DN13418_c0_g1~~TRINITY_DN13418_c0_g1_i1.p1  ORF type:complete len:372 (+),score=44.43 TRINITY_DN13418_c0_g1_i1:76-1191(+)
MMNTIIRVLIILAMMAVASIYIKVGQMEEAGGVENPGRAEESAKPAAVTTKRKRYYSLDADQEEIKKQLGGSTSNPGNTILATAGNHGFRDFIKNVDLNTATAMPGKRILTVMFDEIGAKWCSENLSETTSLCTHLSCTCPYNSTLGTEGYTSCLYGIYICKLRVKKIVFSMGFSLLFIDGDAAIRPNPLKQIPLDSPHDVVGACELCSGACHLPKATHDIVDFKAVSRVKTENYYQINIGLAWFNNTKGTRRAVDETIDLIVNKRLDFKSVDQTVLNRRLMSLSLATLCLPTAVGGLNVRSRSSRPKLFPLAWGVHAARLVSKTGFYKKAFLYANGLWKLPVNEEFMDYYKRWHASPSSFKKYLNSIGQL